MHWRPIVFGQRTHCISLWIIACLIGLIIGCMVTFARLSIPATLLMLPYIAWLFVASVLSHEVVYIWIFWNSNRISAFSHSSYPHRSYNSMAVLDLMPKLILQMVKFYKLKIMSMFVFFEFLMHFFCPKTEFLQSQKVEISNSFNNNMMNYENDLPMIIVLKIWKAFNSNAEFSVF